MQNLPGNIGLTHVVITSVTRDDLADKGSCGFETALIQNPENPAGCYPGGPDT